MSERILVDKELFLGRVDEQQRFRTLLEEILNITRRGILKKQSSTAAEWSHIVLLYGAGGMGKTSLSKRLRDISSGLPPDRHYHNKFTILWLDWEVQRRYDHRLTAREAVTFEAVLDHLYDAFNKFGFMSEFDHFNQKRIQLRDIETHVDRTLNTHTEDMEDLSSSLAKLGSNGLTQLIRERLPEVDSFLPQEEMTVRRFGAY